MNNFKPNSLINKLNNLFQDDPYVIGEWALLSHNSYDYGEYIEHEYRFNNIWKEKFLDGTIMYPEVGVDIPIYEFKQKEHDDIEDYKSNWNVYIMDELLSRDVDKEKILDYILDIIGSSVDEIIP